MLRDLSASIADDNAVDFHRLEDLDVSLFFGTCFYLGRLQFVMNQTEECGTLRQALACAQRRIKVWNCALENIALQEYTLRNLKRQYNTSIKFLV